MSKSDDKNNMWHGADQATVFGFTFLTWSHIELLMEMIIRRELRLDLEEACLVCAPLGGGAKMALLLSLLGRKPDSGELIAAFRDFQTFIGRNSMAHGFALDEDYPEPWILVSREVKTSLKIKKRSFDYWLSKEMMDKLDKLFDASGISSEELDDYAREIAAFEPRPEGRVQPLP